MDSIFRSKAHELQSFIRSRIKDEKLKDKIDIQIEELVEIFEDMLSYMKESIVDNNFKTSMTLEGTEKTIGMAQTSTVP